MSYLEKQISWMMKKLEQERHELKLKSYYWSDLSQKILYENYTLKRKDDFLC
ncbi:hypothetical protein B4110_1800 [Parageobacillus toebii]|uniref:Uncharacterized protein n=1 Tax=Parageobacillus toebii TaxID=153151 RepID=A0A150N1F7_9BACL|nr:hypothetical protein B4110_1800 [Parageobacillus toebii]